MTTREMTNSPHPAIRFARLGALALTVVLAACGTRQPSPGGVSGYPVGGGDYRKDGPHANPPANLASVPDAVPRIEPLASGPNRPYTIMGKRYVPDTAGGPYRVRGRASWYGRQFHGRPTSSGEPYDMYAMTAAHPTLPIPSYARVTRVDNGRSVVVRINDRGPFIAGRVIDLSYVAAYKLDTLAHGTGDVIVERIMPDEIRRGVPAPQPAPRMIAAAPQAASQPAAPMARSSLTTSSATSGLTATSTTSSLKATSPSSPAPVSQLAATSQARANPLAATARPAEPDPIAQLALAVTSTPVQRAPLNVPVPTAPPRATAPSFAAAAVDTKTIAASPSPALGSVFLQLGAFGEAGNAHALANRIRPQLATVGPPAVVQRGDNVYRVQLGPFPDRSIAVTLVEAIYTQTGIMPHVVEKGSGSN